MELLLPLIALFAGGVAAGYYAYKKYYGPNTYMPPVPAVLRKDLAFGYYLSSDDSIQKMVDHCNFIFEPNWGTLQGLLNRAKAHDLPIVLCITRECFGDFDSTKLSPYIEADLRVLFDRLRDENILERITVLYPIDEPDGRHISNETMSLCVQTVRAVASEYSELENVKLGVIYSTHMTYPGFDHFDIVGLDKYGVGSNVLISREFKTLNKRLRPHQKVILVPGGADPWKQNPEAFERYAHSHPEVLGIIAFLWIDYMENGELHKGIGSNETRELYVKLGKRLLGK